MDPLGVFSPPVRRWFEGSFAAPTPAQRLGWPAIARGEHTLIHAPTGSGKTLAAFLWAIDRLTSQPLPDERRRCRVLYVSPLKALAYDVERNLRAPLAGVDAAAETLGVATSPVRVALRTGDTPAAERRRMPAHPPDVLITTPESLFLVLTSRARALLSSVRWVIVDEVHAVAGSKRGSHLALSLERLTEICDLEPQRIGLSATQRPLERIATFLSGGRIDGDAWTPRPVTVVDAASPRPLDLEILSPVRDMTRPDLNDDSPRRSVWPAAYERLLDLIGAHGSTVVFVDTRAAAERVTAELNRLAGEELVAAHHGSLARARRLQVEERLKQGTIRGVVATSTLELGVDMAAVDLVVLVGSPPSVASGLQRAGRSGHTVGATARARIVPRHRADLLEATVVADRMRRRAIEETRVPAAPLDVLAQQLAATVVDTSRTVDELHRIVRGAYPYRDLSREALEAVLDMLAGRYPSEEFAGLRPRIVWDRAADTVRARHGTRTVVVANAGTIPDRGLFLAVLPDGTRVGELEEEMVYETRPGDHLVLGATSWRVAEITTDRVVVTPAPGAESPRMPFWYGDGMGRSFELGRAVGAFVRDLDGRSPDETRRLLVERFGLDDWAAHNLAAFLADEREATGALPSDRTIVVEGFRDELGDWRVAVLSPFGSRVHAPWALAVRRRMRERRRGEVDLVFTDDGMMFRFPDAEEAPDVEALLLDPAEVEDLLVAELAESPRFAARFREAAARALLLPRRRPGDRVPLWLQRRRAADLLRVARRFPRFPVLVETYRELLADRFDLPALRMILDDVHRRRIRVAMTPVDRPSPFALSLSFDFIASYMYEKDTPIAERRATALILDRRLLAELLGEPAFRDLLDPQVVDRVVEELGRRHPALRHPDDLHLLLRDVGPLAVDDLAQRAADTPLDAWLDELRRAGRAFPTSLGGVEHWAAAEDAARVRDGLGATVPPDVPQTFLEPVPDPVGDLVARYARTHGPFTVEEASEALELPIGVVTEVLRRLEADGRLASGGYRPGGTGMEWIDHEVLRRLRRRSLAALRGRVEAVEPRRLAAFLPRWQGVDGDRMRDLDEAVDLLEGASIPASLLEEALAARVSYDPARLDELLASGELVWIGRGPLGARDGRLSLHRRDQVPAWAQGPPRELPDGPLYAAVREHLAARGASFFRDLYAAAGGGDPQRLVQALWDMVWAGEITNDTLAPLRALLRRRPRGRRLALPGSGVPPTAVGRWFLVAELLTPGRTPEEAATTSARILLRRHGVVARTTVAAEQLPGGFAGLYPALRALEDTGEVHRGYFVEGMGGAQFALPAAVDLLRTPSEAGLLVLAAADPANPYGAPLPWPEHPEGRPGRRPGARVVLADGELLCWTAGSRALAFTDDPGLLVEALDAALPARTHLATVDGKPPAGRLGRALESAGFVLGYRGWTRRPGALQKRR